MRFANTAGKWVFAEVELLVEYAVAGVSCFHVLGCSLDGDVEVQVETENGTSNKDDENTESGIFEIGHLHFHRAELDSPTDVSLVWRWWLEAHVLPVGRLQILKVVCLVEI